MIRTVFSSLCGLFVLFAVPAFAQTSGPVGKSVNRFNIEGEKLYYDSERATGDLPGEMVSEDIDKLQVVLTRNPDIRVLVLNSGGGSLWAGEEMARIVIDYGLDTHVEGECSSACVSLFLAGNARTMARGSKIGFHQNSWSASEIADYYKSWRDHENGWETPFEMASWLYNFTQTEAYDHLTYMVDRGVSAEFAIQTERPVDDFWYPSRVELERGGVLRNN